MLDIGPGWKALRFHAGAHVARMTKRRTMITNGPTVFVVDHDHSVRDELRQLIHLKGYRVESFASAGEFLRHGMNPEGACLLLVEVNLPGLTGPGLQKILLQHGVLLPIVFMTDAADMPTAVHALQSGAISLLCKPLDESRLMAEIENALAVWHDEFQQRCEIVNLQRCYSTLTPQEREIFFLAANIRFNEQAAYQPGIVESSVKAHRTRLMKKMHAESEAELSLMAQKLGAVSNHRHFQWMSPKGALFRTETYTPSLLY